MHSAGAVLAATAGTSELLYLGERDGQPSRSGRFRRPRRRVQPCAVAVIPPFDACARRAGHWA